MHYDETIAFYRDVVGLPVIGEFKDSFGEDDGTIFGLPDTSVQIEIIRRSSAGRDEDTFEQLVFYLDDGAAVTAATAALRNRGYQPEQVQHPYWEANGAVTYRDPDGRDVVYAPWVYGRDPEPVDRAAGHAPATVDGVQIELHDGPRDELRPLFELAEDSPSALASYLHKGRVLVATHRDHIVGHLQLVETDQPGVVELKSMAVREDRQGYGIGAQLVEAAVALARNETAATMVVSTAAADPGNLRFYQRQGFRLRSIDRDAFTPAEGYPEGLSINGIALRDRVWLDRSLDASP